MNHKKTLMVSLVLLIIVIVALVGGYFYLTNTKIVDFGERGEGSGSLAPSQNIIVDSATEGLIATSTEGPLPRLRQISRTPVAGFDFIDTPEGYVIWHIERSNGNILQTSTSTRETTRITNTTIPKVYEAIISKNGAQVALRTIDEASGNIQTYIASPKEGELVGSYAPNNIKNVTLSPLKTSFFGIINGVNGGEGLLSPFVGKSSIIFSHTIRNWIPDWVNQSNIVLTTAPSARTQNLSYIFNTASKSLTKIAGPRNGLVVSVSPDLSYALISENKNNLVLFSVINLKKQEESALSTQTIAEKCVWSNKNTSIAYCGIPKTIPSGAYPDAWYQGKTLFDDLISRVDATNGEVREIFNLQTFGVQADITNPILSPDEKYILFSNKRDLTLWMYEF